MRAVIVLPSYNERDNIVSLIDALLARDADSLVCVVDDSSPDGTASLVQQTIGSRAGWPSRVHLIVREKKDGRGGAVRTGFAWAIAQGYSIAAFVEMDCDFSHQPAAIDQGLGLLAQGFDVVIGARYPHGTIIGWPRSRRIFSFLANLLARVLIRWSIADYTNGFRFYSPAAVGVLMAKPQLHKGYIYLSESLSYLLAAGMKVASFPTVFKNRQRGVSNTTWREVKSALTGIFRIALRYRLGRA